MKKVLVTGSSGQSGREIARILEHDYEVVGLDLVEGEKTSVVGSISDWNLVKKITSGVDFIIHPASLHAPHVQSFSRADFIETNVTGTLHLLEAAALHGVQKFVYTSTTSVYGEAMVDDDAATWITEEVPPQPRDIYDITKLTSEGLCADFNRAENLSVICLRVSRFWEEPLADRLFYRMYRGLDVRDVAMSHKLAIENEDIDFELFNISAQPIFDQDDLVDIRKDASRIINKKIPELEEVIKSLGLKMPTEVDRVYVIEKAKRILGYEPRYNIEEMILEIRRSANL